jgi:hypothetical protein
MLCILVAVVFYALQRRLDASGLQYSLQLLFSSRAADWRPLQESRLLLSDSKRSK